MRPGPRGPGNLFYYSRLPPVVSTGFNEAGAARPRKSGCAGNEQTPPQIASMRPGPRGPGNFLEPSLDERKATASMRPGPRGPGNSTFLSLWGRYPCKAWCDRCAAAYSQYYAFFFKINKIMSHLLVNSLFIAKRGLPMVVGVSKSSLFARQIIPYTITA